VKIKKQIIDIHRWLSHHQDYYYYYYYFNYYY